MIRQAIILAGGMGTRLQATLPGLPKCLAPVAGKPFLFHLINYLRSQGIEEFIFSLGYMKELIVQYLYEDFPTLNYKLSIEDEPLGTGGAMRLACQFTTDEYVLVVNGDTLYKIDVEAMGSFHIGKKAACTLALKPMKEFDRYGSVELDTEHAISSFSEKKFYPAGLINGGVYLLRTDEFKKMVLPEKFSFEKDYLEKQPKGLYGFVQDGYFIDIGVPDDYHRAQMELKKPALDLKSIDNSWTLFLDRDGVINHEKPDGYILHPGEFIFYEGSKEAISKLSALFGQVIIVTNQRGVGKNFMSEDDLQEIHTKMLTEIHATGGRIDGIYYCTTTDNKHPERKPNPGMAFKANQEIQGVNLERSLVAGNKMSDMKFGRNAGLYTIYIRSTHPEQPLPHPDIDLAFDSLAHFAEACRSPGKA